MATSYPSTIPIELYRPIFQNLTSIRHLYPLLWVSKAFHAEVEPVMYQTIVLRPLPCNNGDITLVHHFAASPRLASLVRRLNIPNIGPRQIDNPESYWYTVHLALKQMINLRHLNTDNSLSYGQIVPARQACLLEGCRFQLRTLIFRSILTNHMSFLESQAAELEELICFHATGPYWPSKGVSYPRMKVLGFDAAEIIRVSDAMPHVKAIQWTGGIANPDWTDLKPFERIRALNIHFFRAGTITAIGICFSSLIYLKCTLLSEDRNMVQSCPPIDPMWA